MFSQIDIFSYANDTIQYNTIKINFIGMTC